MDALLRMGIAARCSTDVLIRLESGFSSLAREKGADVHWTIRCGEVSGSPEDIQFDLDGIRDEAISLEAERLRL